MVSEAQTSGYETILIESDPHAAGFYRSRGAEQVSSVPSSVVPGQYLPLFRFTVPAAARLEAELQRR